MKNIGLLIQQIEIGKDVYYYSFYSKETQACSEPLKTKITSRVFEIGGQPTCNIRDISGVVALSHLSFEYYPEQYEKPLTPSQWRYREYLEVADCFEDFAHYLRYNEGKRKGIYQ